MAYKQLDNKKRIAIELYLQDGISIPEISKKIGIHKTTIYRELKRNSTKGSYDADVAQTLAHARRAAINQSHAKIYNREITRLIRMGLTFRRSPEQIAHILMVHFKLKICTETIYRMIDFWRKMGLKLYNYLRVKKKERGWSNTRGLQITKRRNIKEREADIYHEEGHILLDVMEGKKGKQEDCFVVAVDARSSFVYAKKISTKTAESFNSAAVYMLADTEELKTCTFDNGTENSQYQNLQEALNVDAYFCDPGRPWQKGGVENAIKELRQYFPKGKSLNRITQDEIDRSLLLINSRPMQKLNGYSPAMVHMSAPWQAWPQIDDLRFTYV